MLGSRLDSFINNYCHCDSIFSHVRRPETKSENDLQLFILFYYICFSQERIRKMEEKRREMELYREWMKPREDLECDDLKVSCSAKILKKQDLYK